MSRLVFISDIHFPHQHKQAWKSFTEWYDATYGLPTTLVVGGDVVDLEVLSSYPPTERDSTQVVDQIQEAVRNLNRVDADCRVILPGNHEDRWARVVYGNNRRKLAGTIGLSLREQFYAQGLDEYYEWVSESSTCLGYVWAPRKGQAVLCMHGHRQANRFGVVHVAAQLAQKFPDMCAIVGHHHRAQLVWRTTDRPRFYCANPHLSGDHEYAGARPDWQRGWTEVISTPAGLHVQQYILDSKGRPTWPIR